MRAELVKLDWLDCILGIGKNLFFNSPMEACVLIANRNKPASHRGKVLFVAAKHLVERKNGESYLTDDHIRLLAKTYHDFETVEGLATVVTNAMIQDKDNSLSVNQFVAGSDDDGETVDMDALLSEWQSAATRVHKALDAFGNLV